MTFNNDDIREEDYEVGDKVRVVYNIRSIWGQIGTVVLIKDRSVGIRLPDGRIMHFGLRSSVELVEKVKRRSCLYDLGYS